MTAESTSGGESAQGPTDDLSRVVTQQAAAAEFGRFVTQSWDITRSLERAADLVCEVLGVSTAAVVQITGPGTVAVRHRRGRLGTSPGQQGNTDGSSMPARTSTPVVGPRGQSGAAGTRAADVVHAAHSLSVPVPVGGRPWGRLIVADDTPRRFGGTEVDFVLSVANVLAAALERERVESGRAAVAAFGRFALESRQTAATMDRALEVATGLLSAPMGVVVRTVGPTGQPGRVAVVAARGPVGLKPGLEYDLGPAVPGDDVSDQPLIIEDWRSNTVLAAFRVQHAPHVMATVSVTVLVEGRPWGRLIICDSKARTFTASEIDIISSVADMLAKALERERVEQVYAAVAAFGRAALASRDISTTIERAVEVVTEVLDAPMGSVIRPLDRPGRFVMVAGRGPLGVAPGQEYEVARELIALHATTEPLVVPDWSVEPRYPPVRAGQAAGVRATLSVTLLVDGLPWGRLSVFWRVPRQFSGADVDVIQSIGHVLAAALERDRIETRLRQTAQDLQRVLLPAVLPTAEGIVTTARYAPCGGDQVGGDWYDVLELPQGGVGLVMGDVEGHDTAAAALMGQVRNVLRAYASEGHTPAEVMTRVNRFVLRHAERLVTCCYAELHPAERSLTSVSAGHPPPLVMTCAGSVGPLPLIPGVPLGLQETHYTEQTTVLPIGATLLLVTDGLVDDVPGAIHRGLEAFAAVARERTADPVDALADALVLRPPGAPLQRDDAALLVVRLTAPVEADDDADQAHRVFGPIPESIRAARHFVRDILADWDLTALQDAATLVVSELVTNTVVHTTSQIHLTLRRSGSAGLWVGVYDDSDRFVRRRRAADDEISGRGLAIVESLAESWGVELIPGGSGKTVWAELAGR